MNFAVFIFALVAASGASAAAIETRQNDVPECIKGRQGAERDTFDSGFGCGEKCFLNEASSKTEYRGTCKGRCSPLQPGPANRFICMGNRA
ncbi:unnamed protein product [Zymoseptoria tritici ST99CH_1A5]|uniref:WSC domain-containing protein n=2 Tax=Zymoseptoria tritici TaxID=1047171 RepID=A0A2H1FIV8_ZYMTR|nr:unnamed protein product [Zymoseptoria tritici ST99CH_1E4]SMR43457.1 unnamed protein product [Zymoseptoria tritici ST99CH_3D1]SMY18603.1 unnamed protein product [Zymoseptoria tritici ST99CH_1A5]